jgi:hypothetical protein
MGKINWARVFLGGVLAGVIINVFEIAWSGFVLAKQWHAAMSALGHPLPSAAIWIFALEALGMGIAAVWLYAAIRPRFGAGLKTAVAAGLALLGHGLRATRGGNRANRPVSCALASPSRIRAVWSKSLRPRGRGLAVPGVISRSRIIHEALRYCTRALVSDGHRGARHYIRITLSDKTRVPVLACFDESWRQTS